MRFSANVWSYLTASENVTLLAEALRFYPQRRRRNFLGFVPWLLAAVGSVRHDPRGSQNRHRESGASCISRLARRMSCVSRVLILASVALALAVVTAWRSVRRFLTSIWSVPIRATNAAAPALASSSSRSRACWCSPRARIEGVAARRSPIALRSPPCARARDVAVARPAAERGEAPSPGFGLYGVLYDYVPGFNGVRVPARYAMIAGLFLAILAGIGVAWLLASGASSDAVSNACDRDRRPRHSRRRRRDPHGDQSDLEPERSRFLRPRVEPTSTRAPPVYRTVARAARRHGHHRISLRRRRRGRFATSITRPRTGNRSPTATAAASRRATRSASRACSASTQDPEAAWQSLNDSGSTHVVVHRNAFAKPPMLIRLGLAEGARRTPRSSAFLTATCLAVA